MRTLKEWNFSVLTAAVKQDLQKWNRLSLSLAGRVQTVKMNILPRYLYLFQCLPIYLPRSFFNLINSITSTFIWAGKCARANKFLLQRSRSVGGLGLPNLLGYYWAVNAQKTLLWFTSPQHSWCQLEANSCSTSLRALANVTSVPSVHLYQPRLIHALQLWKIRSEMPGRLVQRRTVCQFQPTAFNLRAS